MGSKCPIRAQLLVLCQLMVVLDSLQALIPAQNQTALKTPAMLVFGDSIVDPGNNNGLVTLVKSNFPPYGKDFPGHEPTGRFSNGKIPSELLAAQMGIKEYIPPYLGMELDAEDLLTGVSFASGGSGHDPLTAQLLSVLTMSDQLNLFKEYKEKLKAVAGEDRAAYIIAKSLYLVVTGTDDLANTYFSSPFRRLDYDLPSYIKLVVQSASNFLQDLYKTGARKIGFIGVPPVGCIPSQRTLAGGIERECVLPYNQAAIMLNNKLALEVQRLNSTLQGINIAYIDIYTSLSDLILRPFAYGFKESARGCCGTGTFEVAQTCNSVTTPVCEDVSKYVFWDSYHPTERAYQILINRMLQQYASFFDS